MTRFLLAFCLMAAQPAVSHAQDGPFEAWLDGFRDRLLASGVEEETALAMLDGLEPEMSIIEADRSQPEFVRPIWQYLERAVSDLRISNGQDNLAPRRETIDAISSEYGVPSQVLVAIWGLESAYGEVQGDNDVVTAYATLAWEGRRRDWAESELVAIGFMIDRGHATREQLRGSWAGAMGQTQFIPSTYLERAVDWDDDGDIDIWSDEFDALASAANLLSRAGWEEGAPALIEVTRPEGFDIADWEPGQWRSVSDWAVQGVSPASGEWAADDLMRQARLLLPAGANGPSFVTFRNFEVIKRYNNSTAYAMAVSHLADRIVGGEAWTGEWPVDARPLTRTQTRELQAGLNALGFNSGTPDGIAGPNTRRALRAFQRANGFAPDGFVSMAMYEAVQARREAS